MIRVICCNNDNFKVAAASPYSNCSKSLKFYQLESQPTMDFFIWWIKLIYPVQGDEKSGPDYSLTQRFFPSSQVSIAVGLAGFACVLLLVIFVLINKYGRRSKFGMKGKSPQVDRQADSSVSSAFLPVASLCRKPVPPANRLTSKPQRIRNCTYTATSLYFYCTLATSPGLVLKKKRTWMGL